MWTLEIKIKSEEWQAVSDRFVNGLYAGKKHQANNVFEVPVRKVQAGVLLSEEINSSLRETHRQSLRLHPTASRY